MPTNLDVWKSHHGRVYDVESLKEPHVIPLIEGLDFDAENPTAIDVGGGNWSVVSRARLPWPRRFSTAVLDIAVNDYDGSRAREMQVDIEALTADEAPEVDNTLSDFLAARIRPPYVFGADLIVYSEILNYINFRQAMRWFDEKLKPGGFNVVVNKPGRGFTSLFSEDGVTGNQDLIDFVTEDLGHEIITAEYPWGYAQDNERLLLMVTQKPYPLRLCPGALATGSAARNE